jgi:hypothetical protein
MLTPQGAQHIKPIFNPYQVVTLEQLKEAFNPSLVEKCYEKDPGICPKNVNSHLFQGLGPFKYNLKRLLIKFQ